MRHPFFPWTRRRARRAAAEAAARDAAEHDRAVQRITGQDVAAAEGRGGPTAATPDKP